MRNAIPFLGSSLIALLLILLYLGAFLELRSCAISLTSAVVKGTIERDIWKGDCLGHLEEVI